MQVVDEVDGGDEAHQLVAVNNNRHLVAVEEGLQYLDALMDLQGVDLAGHGRGDLGPEPLGVMEPVIYAGASILAVTVALLAGLPAARRATSIEPMAAIRSE